MDLMGRQGFGRTTLDEIAAAAGVSKGAIYWHFKGKDDVLAAIVADYSPIPRIMTLLSEAGDLSFEELVHQVYNAYLDFVGDRISFFRAVFTEVQANPELALVFQRNIISPVAAALAAYMARGAAHRGPRPVHPVLLIQALFGPLIIHLLTRDVLEQQLGLRLERREVVDTFLSIFLTGVISDE